MQQIVMQNATYQVQRIFVGTKPVSERIQERVYSMPPKFPWTNAAKFLFAQCLNDVTITVQRVFYNDIIVCIWLNVFQEG